MIGFRADLIPSDLLHPFHQSFIPCPREKQIVQAVAVHRCRASMAFNIKISTLSQSTPQ
jgi:hypothetical protein